MTQAAARVSSSISLDAMIKYWYHFAIMFEALFILTTIDTGTRIARFLLQEALGKIYKPLERTDWMPGAILSTAIVTFAWGGLIWTGSIDTIWPMFGIANQMLAIIALAVVTTVMFNAGRGKYAPLTILPMLFVVATTCTAAYEMITGRFLDMWLEGYRLGVQSKMVMAGLNIALIAFIVLAVLYIVCSAAVRWVSPRPVESQA
jgi:carbon starvation protein